MTEADAVGADHRRAVADGDVGQRGVRADLAAAADAGGAQQLGAGLDDGVAADAHVDVDPRGGGVDDRHARALVGGHDAPVQFGGQLGQLHPVVDARHQRGVVDVLGPHDPAVLPDDRDDVGEVELLLGVVGAQPVQRRAQHLDVERVDAGVDLADGLLRPGGVDLFDDADDLAVLGAQDAAVARRIGQRRGQHRRRGGLGAVGGDQLGQRVGVQQRNVARGHHDGAGEVGGQRGQPTADGVPGAQLLLLHRDVDRAAQRLGQLGDGRGDALAVMAEHHDEVLRGDLGHRVQGVRQHAAARQRVQHLRDVRAHAGAGPGGQHQDRGLAMRGHLPVLIEAPCRWSLGQPHVVCSLGKPRSPLRRQDSNLNYLNQNQRCCRLHHDGLINS